MAKSESAIDRCKRYRRRILEISQRVPAMHVAGAFSCIEIVDDIYSEMAEGDTFIMSKGHGAMAQYVVLEDMGLVSLDDYCKGPIGCHPDLHVPGIAAATGSLGHGLGMALGMAYADPEHRIFVLLSDGEFQEGSTWEALQTANSLMITNLNIHVDFNGYNSSQQLFEYRVLGCLHERLRHFNFLYPRMQVHHTRKGNPISFMMDNPIWHYRSPTPAEYQQALRELA